MYDSRKSNQITLVVLTLSFGVHVVAWLGLASLPSVSEVLDVFQVQEVSLVEEPPPPPEEPEAPEAPEAAPPPPEEPPPPPVRRERPDTPPPPDAVDQPPPAAEEQIEDFTGETLTNDTGEAWQSAVGNGAAMDNPIGGPTGVVTGRHREGVPEGVIGGSPTAPPGPRLVALADLSSRPEAPAASRLNELVRRFYPTELRNLSIEGTARVRARIGIDGSVSRIRTRSESHAGFGEACIHVLEEAGAWGHPLDRDGNPVATEVSFDCNFSLRI